MTLAQAEAALARWYAAEEAVATGQSYSIGRYSLTRADARFIAARIAHYETRVAQLRRAPARRGLGIQYITPADL